MKLAPLTAAALMSGCAIVNVHTHGGRDVEVRRELGFFRVTANPTIGPVMIEARSLGLSHAQGLTVLGYRSDMLVSVPPDGCRIVLWVETGAAAAAVKQLLAELPMDVCSIDLTSPKALQ